MSNVEAALKLAAAGYRVFPAHGIKPNGECTCGDPQCGSIGKHPVPKNWQDKATKVPEEIEKMWANNPLFNPGIATGGDLLVLDVDGPVGRNSLQQLEKKYGKLPPTRTVETGGGGLHYYFKTDGTTYQGSTGRIGEKLDIRAKGNLVIGPGAQHKSGNVYRWKEGCSPDDVEEAPLPAWLAELILNRKKQSCHEPNSDEVIGDKTAYEWYISNEPIVEGEPSRHIVVFGVACYLRGQRGMSEPEIMREMKRINEERVQPPLEKHDLQTQVKNACKYKREGGADQVFSDDQPISFISMDEVPDEEPRFLYYPYFPQGAVTIIQGDSGIGKTAFLCKLAALVTTGSALLDSPCQDPGNVLLCSVEDDASVLRGRFLASGGNLKRCFITSESYKLSFLSKEIEDFIQQKEIKLVLFDPLQHFLGSNRDMNKANETRPVMAALKAMASRNNCAVVIVSHLGKATKDGPAIYRALGSVDIVASSRSVLHIGRNGKDPEQRIAVHIKHSTSPEGKSIAYTIGNHGGVTLQGYSELRYEDLSMAGKKTRMAAQNPLLQESVVAVFKDILEKNPTGKKLAYNEMGILWPAGVQPKQLLDTMRGKLEEEGIFITTGIHTKRGNGALVEPSEKIPL